MPPRVDPAAFPLVMVRRSVPALLAVAIAALPIDAGPVAAADGVDPQIVGGTRASICQWPSTVLLQNDAVLCSGVLVHPRIVLYAAHCGVDFDVVIFGEDLGDYFVPVLRCDRRSDVEGTGPDDYAYCELGLPVSQLPIAPVLYGCEGDVLAPGRQVVIAGFGEDENQLSGIKRWATTTYEGSASGMLVVGGNGTGASFGDSGGPAFVQLDDGSWRTIGIVSGGPGPGAPIYYVDARSVPEWVEERSGHDITPCHAQDGSWAPGYACGGFATQPTDGGSWDGQCGQEDPLSGLSGTCGPPMAADEDPPRIGILSPDDGTVFDTAPSEVTIEVEASDDPSGVQRVYLAIDGEIVEKDEEEPWGFAPRFERGSYGVRVFAEDGGNNVVGSEEIVLYVGEEPGGCLGCRTGAGGRGAVAPVLVIGLIWLFRRLRRAGRAHSPGRRIERRCS